MVLRARTSARGRRIRTRSKVDRLAAAEARVAPAREVSIRVSVDNLDARRLYERLGYSPTGRFQTTTYAYVDDDGVRREATETDEALVKVRP